MLSPCWRDLYSRSLLNEKKRRANVLQNQFITQPRWGQKNSNLVECRTDTSKALKLLYLEAGKWFLFKKHLLRGIFEKEKHYANTILTIITWRRCSGSKWFNFEFKQKENFEQGLTTRPMGRFLLFLTQFKYVSFKASVQFFSIHEQRKAQRHFVTDFHFWSNQI